MDGPEGALVLGKADEAAQAGWERASYTRRKEIVVALNEAKAPATRAHRLAKALAEMTELAEKLKRKT